MDTPPLPQDSEISLIKTQLDELRLLVGTQAQFLTDLQESDRRQWRLLKLQRKIQSACIAALACAIAVGFAGFSSPNRETLERIVVGVISAAAVGHVGSNFLDKTPEDDQ